MRAHQPGSIPIDIPETVPNPAYTPAPAPAPERAPTKVPEKVPEKVNRSGSSGAFFFRNQKPENAPLTESERIIVPLLRPDSGADSGRRPGADWALIGRRASGVERASSVTSQQQRGDDSKHPGPGK
jgi:hypothetical protein